MTLLIGTGIALAALFTAILWVVRQVQKENYMGNIDD